MKQISASSRKDLHIGPEGRVEGSETDRLFGKLGEMESYINNFKKMTNNMKREME